MLSRWVILEHHYMCQTERWSKGKDWGEKLFKLGRVAREMEKTSEQRPSGWQEASHAEERSPCKENSQRPEESRLDIVGRIQEDGVGSWCELLHGRWATVYALPLSLSWSIHSPSDQRPQRGRTPGQKEAHGSDTHAHRGSRGSTCEQARSLRRLVCVWVTMQYSGSWRFWSQLLISRVDNSSTPAVPLFSKFS